MDRKYIIRQIFIIALAFVVAHFCTLKYYANDYKVYLCPSQHRLDVTGFNVVPKNSDTMPNMFKPYFTVDVTIDCELNDVAAYVEYIQKSERIEIIDGKEVMVVEFSPKVDLTLNVFKIQGKKISKSFKYNVYGYDDISELTYIFRCGDFEKVVYAEWH